MSAVEGDGIFISYRRKDRQHLAGRLRDRLAAHFGEAQVFIDVHAIGLGDIFDEETIRAVVASKVLLAIIGPAWLTATNERGQRLKDPDDPVRREVETAIARGVRVIPVLADGTVMPDRQDLPSSLAGLTSRTALSIRHESFDSDFRLLVTAIEQLSARPDLSEAARLLADAERTARTVTDKSLSEWSLGKVAEALAVTDPRRAERIAYSLTGPPKISALIAVAEALTVTDRARAALLADAESIARSFEALKDDRMPLSLSCVAKAVAATDPDRAAGLFAEALHQARSINATATHTKADALSRVAQALAIIDPRGAERIARSIRVKDYKVRALCMIAEAVAANHPDHAARLLTDAERTVDAYPDETDETYETDKDGASWDIAEALAAVDPDRAERIARTITVKSWKASALGAVAGALASPHPGRAARLFTEALRIARSDSDRNFREPALCDIAEALATTDPDRAEGIARTLSAEWQAVTLSGIAKVLVWA